MKQNPGPQLEKLVETERTPTVAHLHEVAIEFARVQAEKQIDEQIGAIKMACGGVDLVFRQISKDWKAASISRGDLGSFTIWHTNIFTAMQYFQKIGALPEHGGLMDRLRIRLDRLTKELAEFNGEIQAALEGDGGDASILLSSPTAQERRLPGLLTVIQEDAQLALKLLEESQEEAIE